MLTKSMSLNAGSRFINDLLVEALLDNLENAHDYTEIANITTETGASRMDSAHKELLDKRTRTEPCRALDAYVGRYYNAIENFFIDVSVRDDDLDLSFMGRDCDTFKLDTYGDDSFFWFLSHNEAVRLARNDGYGAEFYILKFGSASGKGGRIDSLWWKHELSLQGLGEQFNRNEETRRVGLEL